MALMNYVSETKGELRHVSWPTKAQTINYTLIVIGISVATAVFLSIFDGFFVYLLEKFILKS
ncbi:MAG: preprotein translocase subunit SecE [Candidatus Vogelbacteria bacterium]|nr:preprotein translocase subunit SecE [Candidatus Vogelbacteria bacterium]